MSTILAPNGAHARPMKKVRFQPNGDRYLIVPMDHNDTMKSLPDSVAGILLPDTADKTLGWYGGMVLEVGNGHRLETDTTVPMFFKQGDTVMVTRLAGHEVYLDGKAYRIVNQVDILGSFVDYD